MTLHRVDYWLAASVPKPLKSRTKASPSGTIKRHTQESSSCTYGWAISHLAAEGEFYVLPKQQELPPSSVHDDGIAKRTFLLMLTSDYSENLLAFKTSFQ